MSLAVAVVNLIYFAWTGDSLSSPRYGALTRRGHQSNPGGAISLTVGDARIRRFLLLDAPQAAAPRAGD
jgi:hypothetical protein